MAAIGSTTLPAPLSISDILRKHSRERLLVNPLQWTAQQLQLLECQFRRRKVPLPPKPVNSTGHCAWSDDAIGGEPQQQPRQDEQREGRWDEYQRPQPGNSHAETIHDAVGYLRKPTVPGFRASTIEYLLADYGIHRAGNCLELSFDRRHVANVRTDGVFSHSDSKFPTLAYLDLETHAERREDHIIPPVVYKGRSSGSRLRNNSPVIRLGKKKLCRVRPTIEVEDPYILAALISLAQKQRECRRGKGMKTPERVETSPSNLEPATRESREPATCYKVHLIALPDGTRNLCFYNASIPSAFLDKLDQPSLYFPSEPVLVSYCCIPLRRTSRTTSAIDDIISAVRDEARGMAKGKDDSPDTLLWQ
ncbi:hypothetical protein EDB80DRAFT_204490 [Ilyonectria destructans]|nr:hypothetical protein EDB80DRAFT_204490 [Ilyonectria destructans]